MTIKLKLDSSAYIRLKEPIYIVKDNDYIYIEAESKYNLQHAVFIFENSGQRVVSKYANTLRVPDKVVFAGKISLTIRLLSDDGNVLKEWRVFPIIVKEEIGETILLDWCASVEQKLAELDERTKIIL